LFSWFSPRFLRDLRGSAVKQVPQAILISHISASRRSRSRLYYTAEVLMEALIGVFLGFAVWFVLRFVLMGLYTGAPNERAVKISFGRAVRVPGNKTTLEDPIAEFLRPEERARYTYPQVRVIPPGGPYFKMPWEKIRKVSIATMTMNMAVDLEDP